ncbi:MAG: phosphonate ABC transporter, permease protein PhnE [Rhodobacteraceae bacterium]|nr:phosphonate ABC transporter, permease protein PhnE [Paracoccaceae bacterium]
MVDAQMTLHNDLAQRVKASFTRRRLFSLAAPVVILAYLIYCAAAFDVLGVAQRARMDNALILLSDFWSYRVQVTRDNRKNTVLTTIEGEARYAFPPEHQPDWVKQTGDETVVDLGHDNIVTIDAQGARYAVPGYGTIDVTADAAGKLTLTAPQPLPDWISASDSRVAAITSAGRFSYTRSKVEVARSFPGWELFFFTFDSPFYGKSLGQLIELAFWDARIDPAQSNFGHMLADFWGNSMWHHGDVAWALFETILMAFLGTISGAILALPLSFLAASNMMPSWGLRFGMRRVFDFIRGVDALIWTIILSRAFGPGPMTGALAILMVDTGLFGKLFSEALENIDEKQVEGIRSTGANALQRARFGVLPQVMPVLLSQVLYNLESNTRSATVIGAIVGGGIGLLLTQAIATQKDWEDVFYYVILIVLMVMLMDRMSGWLRRKLIKGE